MRTRYTKAFRITGLLKFVFITNLNNPQTLTSKHVTRTNTNLICFYITQLSVQKKPHNCTVLNYYKTLTHVNQIHYSPNPDFLLLLKNILRGSKCWQNDIIALVLVDKGILSQFSLN